MKEAGYDPDHVPADLVALLPKTAKDLVPFEEKALGPPLENPTEADEIALVRVSSQFFFRRALETTDVWRTGQGGKQPSDLLAFFLIRRSLSLLDSSEHNAGFFYQITALPSPRCVSCSLFDTRPPRSHQPCPT
jgi:hypothetical protein